ncbi:hypothetical protein ACHAXS_006618 [Conticribra weissflogii]
MSFRSIICILAYDQKCIDSICLPVTNENSNELSDYSNSCGATVNIAWFDTILNHSLIVLNVVTSVLLLRILTKLTACGKKRISGGSEIFASKTKHDNPGETTTMADEWTDEEKKKYFLFLHSEKRKIFRPKYIPSILSLMFVVAFQVILCLAVKCVGVSIIWCSAMGWLLMCLKVYYLILLSCDAANKRSSLVPQGNRILSRSMDEVLRHLWRTCHISLSIVWFDSVVLVYYFIVAEGITNCAHLCAVVLGIVLWSGTATERVHKITVHDKTKLVTLFNEYMGITISAHHKKHCTLLKYDDCKTQTIYFSKEIVSVFACIL